MEAVDEVWSGDVASYLEVHRRTHTHDGSSAGGVTFLFHVFLESWGIRVALVSCAKQASAASCALVVQYQALLLLFFLLCWNTPNNG